MDQFRVGIIGCGRPWKSEGATGFGMSHCHAKGYADSPDAKIVALSDLVIEHAEAFQAIHGGDPPSPWPIHEVLVSPSKALDARRTGSP